MTKISGDPAVLDGIGAELREIGRGLVAAGGQAEFGGAEGGSTPLTGRALAICSQDWSTGLAELGELASALGALAQATGAGFRKAGGGAFPVRGRGRGRASRPAECRWPAPPAGRPA